MYIHYLCCVYPFLTNKDVKYLIKQYIDVRLYNFEYPSVLSRFCFHTRVLLGGKETLEGLGLVSVFYCILIYYIARGHKCSGSITVNETILPFMIFIIIMFRYRVALTRQFR